jgi:hypothetical protein|tara:strand:+ start:341 stop:613 length:273 start_codon:yes stop_codon:yes gene_type:complete
MRYYLGQCEFKWTHADTKMERMWVMRELGTELYKTVETNNWELVLLKSSSIQLPGDTYCRCDIYADSNDDKLDSHFALKYPQAEQVEKII